MENYLSIARKPKSRQNGGGFLLVYSVTDPKSFENIRKIYDKILSHSPNDFGWKQSRFGFLEKSD